MLGKLIKYEFKASSRLFLLLYAALIVVSIVNLLLEPLQNMADTNNAAGAVVGIVSGIFMFGYVILVIAVILVTIVMIIMRFYKNLMGDEGYLMFTLPVSADSHILSKLITSVVWSILSFLVVIGSILILTLRLDSFDKIGQFFDQMNAVGFNIGAWSAGIIVSIIIYIVCVILMFYAAMAVGPNLTKNRLLGSFLGYIIFYTVSQIVGLLSIVFIYFTDLLSDLEQYGNEIIDPAQGIEFANTVGIQLFIYLNILNLVLIAIYYFASRFFLKNKLNLA